MTSPLYNAPLADPYASAPAPSASARRTGFRPPNWLREPLLHFVMLGGLLFAVDHCLIGKADDPHNIVVGAEVDSEAIETFEAARGRKPNAQELEALHHVWLDNEVLYREGLALQVDKGDPAIRERVIFKALSVVDSNVKLPPADDQVLRAWFERHRDKYDEPARYDFEEAALSGDASESTVQDFVAALNGGLPGDAKAGLRVFKDRPLANLVDSYGSELAKALDESKPGVWQALSTKSGWRALKLDSITKAQAAVYEPLRGVVLQDWKDAIASEQRTAAVRALAQKYTVKYQPAIKGSIE